MTMKEKEVPTETSISQISDSDNPLSEIEADIRNLIKKCGSLSHELNESKKKWDSDTKKILLEFIEVVDAFENVFGEIDSKVGSLDNQTKSWIESFRTVHKMLLRALRVSGVYPIETVVGEKANPYWHNIIEVIKDPALENETIVEESKKGYLWNGKLLRAADVKAVRNE